MNISSNNMKWFSEYTLINKLFSQKNGNQAGAILGATAFYQGWIG